MSQHPICGRWDLFGEYLVITSRRRRANTSVDDHRTSLDWSQPGQVCDRSELEALLVYSSQSVGIVMSATVGTLGTLSVMEGGGDICLWG